MKEYRENDIPPFRLADELWHVGTAHGPSYLLSTSDGIVLIDTGYPQDADLLLCNIRLLGFDPLRIRHIIHTHGHIDHVGGTRALVEISGAKTYISEIDAGAVRGTNDLLFAKELGMEFDEFFEPDVLLHDGDVFLFGDTPIRFVHSPGHTMGTMSLYFPLHVNGKEVRAGLFGGAGLNTFGDDYLNSHGLPLSLRDDFLLSIDKALMEDVELHVGNHLGDNDALKKADWDVGKENPFLADNTYRSFLFRRRAEAVDKFEKSQKECKKS